MDWEFSTIKGKNRATNQDAISINGMLVRNDNLTDKGSLNNKRAIFILCDGMGGLTAGEESSVLVAEKLHVYLDEIKTLSAETIRESILRANEDLISFSKIKYGYATMGTTVLVIIIENNKIWSANVGDTKCIAYSNEGMSELTVDDASDVNNLNILSQCIGGFGKTYPKPHIKSISSKNITGLLMSSDGVHRFIKKNRFSESTFANCKEAVSLGSEDDCSIIKIYFADNA